ncbi:MAG: tyrosine-type recombinase/integrase [Akkermansia muciniphila]|nr:tyrosine-type recombinase/integrase [Akkermansia muciniphila]
MAGLIKRPGAASWVAIITETADSRKQCRKSTHIPVTQAGKKEAQTRKEAQSVADGYEAVYRGRILYSKQAELFRAAAGTTAEEQKALDRRLDILRELAAAGGTARRMPTVREYLEAFPMTGGEQNRLNAKRAFTQFLAHLGREADMRLDRLTREHCQGFIDTQAARVRASTVSRYRISLSAAFNAAVVGELLMRNPMSGTKLQTENAGEKIERDMLTPAEIARFLQHAPQHWRDMVNICLATGGQRIGDCACLKWNAVDLAAGTISIITQKTGAEVKNPLIEPLKSRLEELWAEREPGEEYVLPDMARRYSRSKGVLSVEFVALLEACGISTVKTGSTKGDRRQVHSKTFHSLRRGLVSLLRDGGASADMSRAIVGHASEEVERTYYRATMEGKAAHLAQALQAIMGPQEAAPAAAIIPPTPTAPEYRRQA